MKDAHLSLALVVISQASWVKNSLPKVPGLHQVQNVPCVHPTEYWGWRHANVHLLHHSILCRMNLVYAAVHMCAICSFQQTCQHNYRMSTTKMLIIMLVLLRVAMLEMSVCVGLIILHVCYSTYLDSFLKGFPSAALQQGSSQMDCNHSSCILASWHVVNETPVCLWCATPQPSTVVVAVARTGSSGSTCRIPASCWTRFSLAAPLCVS